MPCKGLNSAAITLLVLIILFINLSSASTGINSCQTITQPGTYILIQNITTSSTCLKVDSDNVMIDGRGFSISGDADSKDYGILINNHNDVAIKDLTIHNFEYGIRIDNSDSVEVSDSTLHHHLHAIKLESSSNSRINDNHISNSDNGISLIASSSSFISDNDFEDNEIALSVKTSDNILIDNNQIMSNNKAIYLSTSNNNEFTGNLIQNNNIAIDSPSSSYNIFSDNSFVSNANSIMLAGSANNLFENSILDSPVSLKDSSNTNTFLNFTYDKSNEHIDAGSKLIRNWNIDIKVIDNATLGSISNSDIKIWNSRGDIIFEGKTNNQGVVSNIEITDYANNGRRQISYNPYMFFASKSGFTEVGSRVVISGNDEVVLKLVDLNPVSNIPITDISTVPDFPFVNNQQVQEVLIFGNVNKFPLAYRFKIFNEIADLVHSSEYSNITNLLDMPLRLSIPSLENGTYTVVMEVLDDDRVLDLHIGIFFVIPPQEPLPEISDLSTNPQFPITMLPGTSQNVLISFTIEEPVNITFFIKNDSEIVYNSSSIDVNLSSFPITLSIPSLSVGTYNAIMSAKDSKGNENNITLGVVNVIVQQSSPSGGGGGGGGGGSLGATRASNRTALNNTNTTINNLNNTRANETFTPFNNQTSRSPISLITGAVTGVLGNKAFLTVFFFLVVIVCSYILIKLNISPKNAGNTQKSKI